MIVMSIKGVKCDNPSCDYRDDEAEFQPAKYLNIPCPKCGCPLLTEEDYQAIKSLEASVNFLNKYFSLRQIPDKAIKCEMNGTGEIEITWK